MKLIIATRNELYTIYKYNTFVIITFSYYLIKLELLILCSAAD